MYRQLRVLIATGALTAVLFGSIAGTAHAEDHAWSVSVAASDQGPTGRVNYSYEVDPGAVVNDTMTVANTGDEPLDLGVYVTDALTTATGGIDLLPGDRDPDDLGTWAHVDTDRLSLDPGEQTTVDFTLTVPDDARPGDHSGGIVTSLITDDGGSVELDHRMAIRINIRVSGVLASGLEMSPLAGSAVPWWPAWNPGTQEYAYYVANTGNVRAVGHETVTISSLGGLVTTTHRGTVDELLVGGAAERRGTVDRLWPLGPSTIRVELVPEGIGGQIAAPVAEQVVVWSIPWAWLAALLVVIGVAVFIGWRRGLRRAEDEEDRDDDEAEPGDHETEMKVHT